MYLIRKQIIRRKSGISLNILNIELKDVDKQTLGQIVARPRLVSPQDIDEAVFNTEFEFIDCDNVIENFIKWIMIDFFKLAHQTGLYNRQLELWKSISHIKSGELKQLSQGFFKKSYLPFYDIFLNDSNNNCLILFTYIAQFNPLDFNNNIYKQIVSSFLNRVQHIKDKNNSLKGCFCLFPNDIDNLLTDIFINIIKKNDPLLDYEARLPQPIDVPLNIVSFLNETNSYKLIYPELYLKRNLLTKNV